MARHLACFQRALESAEHRVPALARQPHPAAPPVKASHQPHLRHDAPGCSACRLCLSPLPNASTCQLHPKPGPRIGTPQCTRLAIWLPGSTVLPEGKCDGQQHQAAEPVLTSGMHACNAGRHAGRCTASRATARFRCNPAVCPIMHCRVLGHPGPCRLRSYLRGDALPHDRHLPQRRASQSPHPFACALHAAPLGSVDAPDDLTLTSSD